MKFEEFDLAPEIIEAISYMGFETASPIQEKAIPAAIKGKDVLAVAQTGTGKTAAFTLPVLHNILQNKITGTSTLIITPTREIALQIDRQIQGFSYFLGINSLAIYGGGDADEWEQQKKALRDGVEVIVATPGKLLSHLGMNYAKTDKIQHLILDEADRMLDMGFLDDIKRIISKIPKKRQTLMFSATMPPKIEGLAKQILNEPEFISIAISKPAESVFQGVYLTYENQKTPLINHLISDQEEYKSILVFTSTKKKVNDIVRGLRNKNYRVEAISSDFEQSKREEIMTEFRANKIRVLVATDVISRGVDIPQIDLVFNYDAPGNAEEYVHRIGRTGRAGAEGVALTLINELDMEKFDAIEKLIEKKVYRAQMPDFIGEGPKWKVKVRRATKGKKPFRK
ncbi:MAG: ATP-dependent RNA helicase [Flavobacteriales bacterium]|nr:ATP-dependent RNA helicase [Flavobacteriales bacterium]MBO73536.1 ATP-dependent RNA helicase [Flavobacteriales bacterium]|tara:strand:+ start:160 stop:1353 length:1194 start_codon:yes stop_codon:yes gene_type:complete